MWPCSGTVFIDRLVERPHIRRLSRVATRLRHLADYTIPHRQACRRGFGRDDQRPLQGRGDPPARTVAQLRSRRVRYPRVGQLVQPSPAARTHRQHPACRSRRTVLCCRGQHRYGSVTHNPMPPANPGRFRVHRNGSYPAHVNSYRQSFPGAFRFWPVSLLGWLRSLGWPRTMIMMSRCSVASRVRFGAGSTPCPSWNSLTPTGGSWAGLQRILLTTRLETTSSLAGGCPLSNIGERRSKAGSTGGSSHQLGAGTCQWLPAHLRSHSDGQSGKHRTSAIGRAGRSTRDVGTAAKSDDLPFAFGSSRPGPVVHTCADIRPVLTEAVDRQRSFPDISRPMRPVRGSTRRKFVPAPPDANYRRRTRPCTPECGLAVPSWRPDIDGL